MRWTGNGRFVLPSDNPGIRVEPAFVSEAEASALVGEVEQLARHHGYEHTGDDRVHTMRADGTVASTADGVVNNTRVTGRLEKPYAIGMAEPPPWGYGDEFDVTAVPPALRSLSERIARCGRYALGPLRDITINGRSRSFFKLDPHIDPADDGPDVFILSMLSSVVLTFTPPDETLARLGGERRPLSGQELGMRSWTSCDIDVLCEPRTLLHFTGAARSEWKHAIRAGLVVEPPGEKSFLCDWWGANDYLLRRSERRWSVVMAFGAPAGG